MTQSIRLIILIATLLFAATFTRAASVSLPLGGVYRTGKYMPVQLVTESERGSIAVSATGSIATETAVQPSMRAIIPWLMMSDLVHDAGWTDPSGARHDLPPLHPLNENDRLVGLIGADAKLAQSIFTDVHVVPIDLGVAWNADPAPAWEALDAIVVTENNLPALAPNLDALLSAGTTIAVNSVSRPTLHRDEWIHAGALWLLHRQPLISHDPINPEVYGPTYGWIRGRTPIDRARILILAIVLSIAVVSISLWRSRWAVWSIVAICIGGAFVVFAYDRQRPRMLELRLGVAAANQLDAWAWYSPITATEGRHPFTNLSKPVFASRRQSRELEVTLRWSETPADRAFTFHLDRNQSLAFADVMPMPSIDGVKPEVLSDIREFAQHIYMRTGDQIAGTVVLPEHGPLTTAILNQSQDPSGK